MSTQRSSRLWIALTALLLVVGACQVGAGVWIDAQAWLAQVCSPAPSRPGSPAR